MGDKACRWTKLIDWYQVCDYKQEPIRCYKIVGGGLYCRPEVTKASKPEKEGSFLGWLWCSIKCSGYDHVPEYNWYTDKCVCKGNWLPIKWRGR